MEVRSLNVVNPQANPIHLDARKIVSDTDIFSPAASKKNQIDIDDIMMDLEEVKHFLYMVVGGGVHVKEEDKVGNVVNKLA